MVKMIQFEEYVDNQYSDILSQINSRLANTATVKLLDEYKDIVLKEIIIQFGLKSLEFDYRDGGNITTTKQVEELRKQMRESSIKDSESVKKLEAFKYIQKVDQKNVSRMYDRKNFNRNIVNDNDELISLSLSSERKLLKDVATKNAHSEEKVIKLKDGTKLKLSDNLNEQTQKFHKEHINKDGTVKNGYNKKRNLDIFGVRKGDKEATDIEHVVSQKEIHDDSRSLLTLSDDEMHIVMNDTNNKTLIERSANQSKGANDAIEWAESTSSKMPNTKNKDRFDLEMNDVKEKYNRARNFVDHNLNNAVFKKYKKEVISAGTEQGYSAGKQQAVGELLSILLTELIFELKLYFKKWSMLKGLKKKSQEFSRHMSRVVYNTLLKTGKIINSFKSGFIAGFLANFQTFIINLLFKSTFKRITKIIGDSFRGIVEFVKIIAKSEDNLSSKAKFKKAVTSLTITVTAALGGIFSEQIIVFLTPIFTILAPKIGLIIGGALTGIVSAMLIAMINDFEGFIEDLKSIYKATIGYSKTMEELYNNIYEKMEERYKVIFDQIVNEYEKLRVLTSTAFDPRLGSQLRFENTISYAKILGTPDSKIIETISEIDDFFMN